MHQMLLSASQRLRCLFVAPEHFPPPPPFYFMTYQIARDTLGYVLRNLAHSEGGFYGAEDADSLPSADANAKRGVRIFCDNALAARTPARTDCNPGRYIFLLSVAHDNFPSHKTQRVHSTAGAAARLMSIWRALRCVCVCACMCVQGHVASKQRRCLFSPLVSEFRGGEYVERKKKRRHLEANGHAVRVQSRRLPLSLLCAHGDCISVFFCAQTPDSDVSVAATFKQHYVAFGVEAIELLGVE